MTNHDYYILLVLSLQFNFNKKKWKNGPTQHLENKERRRDLKESENFKIK